MRKVASAALTAWAAAQVVLAQSGPIWLPHVPFVETSPEVSNTMLTLADTKPSDVVYDLGCGDGRIVIMAARTFGARGVGIDIDPERIKEANLNARAAGVSDKVRFIQGDLLYADIHEATVVTMFLLPTVNAKLRPKLFSELRAGTRVVTPSFDIGDWAPLRKVDVKGMPVYLWSIPPTTSITGQVRMEDGDSPPIPTGIERVCGQQVTFEGFANAVGTFRIALERYPAQTGADESRRWAECRIRASLPGYRSEVLPLQASAGIIVLHRAAKSDASLVSARARLAPAAARVELEKGRDALARRLPDAAQTAFTRAVEIYPGYAAAWFQLAALNETLGRMERSVELYRKAVALEPKYLSPYLGLIQVAMHGDRWEEIAGYAEKIIALDPESFPDAYLYHAIGKLTLRDFASAERSARMAMKLDTGHQFPRAEYVLGLALSAQGDLSGAQEHLAQYIESDPKAPDLEQIKERIRMLEKARTAARQPAH
jgi:tetratricopeptide (TPR) repeat protein